MTLIRCDTMPQLDLNGKHYIHWRDVGKTIAMKGSEKNMDAESIYEKGTSWINAEFVRNNKLNGKQVTIASVSEETFAEGEKPKLVLTFEETEDSKMALNYTNARTVIDSFGSETDDWNGKRMRVVLAKTTYSGKTVDTVQLSTELDE